MEVEPAVSVGGGTNRSEVHLNYKASKGGFDPWYKAVWLECVVGDVLHLDKGGELGEAGDVEEWQLCV